VRAELLGRESVFPVCTPAYAESLGLTTPADLMQATLLHADIEEDWAAWFAMAGLSSERFQRGPRLGDAAAIVQAAIDGQGVALGRSRLVADDLANERLISPFHDALPASFSYWFVWPAGKALTANLSAVFEWTRAEFESTITPV
jgi:LysR family glycine cleavage system transcriptional activator